MTLNMIKSMSKISYNLYKDGKITLDDINNNSVRESVERMIALEADNKSMEAEGTSENDSGE